MRIEKKTVQIIDWIDYNWFACSQGEDYFTYTVGKKEVKEIQEERFGSKFIYWVYFNNGDSITVFNANRVHKTNVEIEEKILEEGDEGYLDEVPF